MVFLRQVFSSLLFFISFYCYSVQNGCCQFFSRAIRLVNGFIFPPLPVIPDVEISTSPPMQKLAVGTAVNLTCMAQPRSIDAGYYDRWTEYIQWYDPQGKPVGHKCVQGRTMVLKLRCTLMLKNLTVEKLGNYTCEAGNPYPAHCRRKSVEIGPQGKQQIRKVIQGQHSGDDW